MGAHSLEELMRLYTLEKITLEQTLGQVLQHLQQINASLQELHAAQQRMEKLEREIEGRVPVIGPRYFSLGCEQNRKVVTLMQPGSRSHRNGYKDVLLSKSMLHCAR